MEDLENLLDIEKKYDEAKEKINILEKELEELIKKYNDLEIKYNLLVEKLSKVKCDIKSTQIAKRFEYERNPNGGYRKL